jgi:hypothetical protein
MISRRACGRRRPWAQTLTDDPAQRIGEAMKHLLLLVRLKHTENTIDGLARINRVRAHDEWPVSAA